MRWLASAPIAAPPLLVGVGQDHPRRGVDGHDIEVHEPGERGSEGEAQAALDHLRGRLPTRPQPQPPRIPGERAGQEQHAEQVARELLHRREGGLQLGDPRVVLLRGQVLGDERADGGSPGSGPVRDPGGEAADRVEADIPVDDGDGEAQAPARGRGRRRRVHGERGERGERGGGPRHVEAVRADAGRRVDAQHDVERGSAIGVGGVRAQGGPADGAVGAR